MAFNSLKLLLAVLLSFSKFSYSRATVCPLDLALIIDKSGSICDTDPDYVYLRDSTCNNWKNIINFLESIFSGMPIGPTDIKVATITFESFSTLNWNFNRYKTNQELVNGISNLKYRGGNTNTSGALRMARRNLFSTWKHQIGVQKAILIITDGKPTYENYTLDNEIFQTMNSGIKMISVGSTNDIDKIVLRKLSSSPHIENQNFFAHVDMRNVPYLKNSILSLCNAITTVFPNKCKIDLILVVDNSGSICDADHDYVFGRDRTCRSWQNLLYFLRNLINSFTIGFDDTQIGLVTFSSISKIQWGLRRYQVKKDLINAINNLPFVGLRTDLTSGLRNALSIFRREGRGRDTKMMTLVITNDIPNVNEMYIQNAKRELTQFGARMIVVGVTTKINETSLREISTYPHQLYKDYFTAPTFKGANHIVNHINHELCGVPCLPKKHWLAIIIENSPPNCHSNECPSWINLIDFISNLINQIQIGPENFNVALITYSTKTTIRWNFQRFYDKQNLLQALRNIPFELYSNNNLLSAIQTTRNLFSFIQQSEMRSILLLTHRAFDSPQINIEREVRYLESLGINLFSIVIGQFGQGFTFIPSSFNQKNLNVFQVENSRNLNSLDHAIKLAVLCPAPRFPTFTPVLFTTAPRVFCRPRDVIFLVDSSGSICDKDSSYVYLLHKTCNNWKNLKNFVYNLVNDVNLGPPQLRVGLITFDNKARSVWDLTKYKDKMSILQAITNLEFTGGYTNTAEALQIMNEMFRFSHNYEKVGIIITDGEPTIRAMEIPQRMKEGLMSGVKMISVGVTNQINEETLKSLSSPPNQLNRDYFMSSSYADINNLRTQLEIQICNV